MSVVATTPRLILRHWEAADRGAADHIYGDAETMRLYAGGRPFGPAELAESLEQIIASYAKNGFGNYGVVETANGTLIGHCGIHRAGSIDRVEADWVIDKRFQRRGYAYEAAIAVLLRGFEVHGFETVWACVRRENLASAALCRKLGMREEESGREDELLYSLGRSEFRVPPELDGKIEVAPLVSRE